MGPQYTPTQTERATPSLLVMTVQLHKARDYSCTKSLTLQLARVTAVIKHQCDLSYVLQGTSIDSES